MKSSIITPVWNRADLTFNFLNQNYYLYHERDDLEFVIINNGSTDSTAGVLEKYAKRFNVIPIHNEHNLGFAKANNQGAAIAKGDTLIFINNDVHIAGSYIDLLCGAVEENPADLVGAEVLTYNTGWNVFGDTLVAYIPGWCLAMSAVVYKELGGFDERYTPGDYEDLDLSYTATSAGRALIPVHVPLIHLSGQTGQQLPNRIEITQQHRCLFAKKWGLKCN